MDIEFVALVGGTTVRSFTLTPEQVKGIKRAIVRNRAGDPVPEGGWPLITEAEVATYAITRVGEVGDSYIAQYKAENAEIQARHLRENDNVEAALAAAAAEIAALDNA